MAFKKPPEVSGPESIPAGPTQRPNSGTMDITPSGYGIPPEQGGPQQMPRFGQGFYDALLQTLTGIGQEVPKGTPPAPGTSARMHIGLGNLGAIQQIPNNTPYSMGLQGAGIGGGAAWKPSNIPGGYGAQGGQPPMQQKPAAAGARADARNSKKKGKGIRTSLSPMSETEQKLGPLADAPSSPPSSVIRDGVIGD